MAAAVVNSNAFINTSSASQNLGWTPTVGNWLIVFIGNNGGAANANTGWTRYDTVTVGLNLTGAMYYRQVQVGDTATITPTTIFSVIAPWAVWEISGLPNGLPTDIQDFHLDFYLQPMKPMWAQNDGLILAAAATRNSTAVSVLSGVTFDHTHTPTHNASRDSTCADKVVTAGTSFQIAATYPGAAYGYGAVILLNSNASGSVPSGKIVRQTPRSSISPDFSTFDLKYVPTPGNWLVAIVSGNDATFSAASGWTKYDENADASRNITSGVYYHQVQVGDTRNVNITAPASGNIFTVAMLEFGNVSNPFPAAFVSLYKHLGKTPTPPAASTGTLVVWSTSRGGAATPVIAGTTFDTNYSYDYNSAWQCRGQALALIQTLGGSVTATVTSPGANDTATYQLVISAGGSIASPGVGSIVYTGHTIPMGQTVAVGAGNFEYTGEAVDFETVLKIPVGVGEFVYNGESVIVGGRISVQVDAGAVVYDGQGVHVNQVVTPGHGTLTYTGQLAHIIKVDVSQAGTMFVFDSFPSNAQVSQAGALAIYSVSDAKVSVSQAGAMVVYDYMPCATTFCQVWIIYRLDGQIFAFTSLDEDITFMGHLAKHCASLNPTATEGASDLDSVGNYELAGIISDDAITNHDLWAGAFDGAYVEAWLVDWDGEETPRRLAAGTCGKLSQGDSFTMEVLGMGGKLQQQAVIPVATAKCRWQFGKGQCPVDVTAITQTAPITTAVNRRTVRAAALVGYTTHPFTGGLVTALTGDNAGFKSEIKTFDAATGEFIMWIPAPYPWQAGDSLSFAPGCDQLAATCKHYGAFADFGGYPDVPGDDAMNESPDAVYDT